MALPPRQQTGKTSWWELFLFVWLNQLEVQNKGRVLFQYLYEKKSFHFRKESITQMNHNTVHVMRSRPATVKNNVQTEDAV